MSYIDIRNKREKDTNDLFTSLGVFWAFGKEQFEENKTPLQEGEKYVSIGMGGYMPQHNVDSLTSGMKAIEQAFKQATKDAKTREKHILYELNNHECFYTGNIESAVEALGSEYTTEEVSAVYKKFRAKRYEK